MEKQETDTLIFEHSCSIGDYVKRDFPPDYYEKFRNDHRMFAKKDLVFAALTDEDLYDGTLMAISLSHTSKSHHSESATIDRYRLARYLNSKRVHIYAEFSCKYCETSHRVSVGEKIPTNCTNCGANLISREYERE